MTSSGCGVLFSAAIILSLSNIATWCLTANALAAADKVLGFSKHGADDGKKWALLVAGSRGYSSYRHQSDACHAYQILKRGGLEDENIIVFMYDDIASNPENPRPGVIINKPNGTDVYSGVPKDYTGDAINPENLYAAILGNKSALNGGSGKVLDSGPNDHIFIYYSDHGSPGVLGMPAGGYVYAEDLIDVLQKKHASRGYKSMVLYVEACEAGIIFEGLLPDNLNIYATTASNAEDSSYGTYCPGEDVPSEYSTCLGGLYSVSWMEDCDKQDLSKETLGKQYEIVRRRTNTSHVMQYGDMRHRAKHLSTYMGEAPTTEGSYTSPSISSVNISQSDADLLHFQYKFHRAPAGSHQKLEAQKQLLDEIARRKQEDYKIKKIGELLFGNQKSSKVLMNVRPSGQPVVDDWDCLKMFVSTYENYCGPLSTYGMKYTRAIANICNAGVTKEKMTAASRKTCSKIHKTLDLVLH